VADYTLEQLLGHFIGHVPIQSLYLMACVSPNSTRLWKPQFFGFIHRPDPSGMKIGGLQSNGVLVVKERRRVICQ